MNIQSITPALFNKTSFNTTNNNNFRTTNTIKPNYAGCLSQDTVSFSGGIQIAKKTVQKAAAETAETMGDIMEEGYEKNKARYKILGTRLMDTSEAIAIKFKKRGVKFYRSYCEKGVIKSTKSFFSKFRRTPDVQDRVRTTLCVENPYDFKLIRDIINEYELRDYEIQMIPDKVSGRKVLSRKPDFDIRLSGVTEENTKVLGPKLQKCIGHAQSSGYSDIQFRLIDKMARKKDDPPLEVLIVFGKHTLAAKELESYYSYDIRRILEDELFVSKIKNPQIHSPAHRIQSNIGIISDVLKNSISKPLFYNAANKDFYHSKDQLPVELNESAVKTITGLFEGIRLKVNLHYNAEINKLKQRVNSDGFKPELEKIFKASPEYQERKDKTVYVQDLLNTRRDLIKDLKSQKEQDLKIVHDARERFNETASVDFQKAYKEILAQIKD